MPKIKVIELFAGVGGFRLGLEGWEGKSATSGYKKRYNSPYEVIWSNQWEPPGIESKQFASKIYESKWGKKSHSNQDIDDVIENDYKQIPENYDLLTGGFPCQDYSVANTLKRSGGIKGKKGVLWWNIHSIIDKAKRKPRYIF